MVRDRERTSPRGLPGSALWGDLGVSRPVKCDFLSVLLIYPRIFFECVYCISSLIRDILLCLVLCYMFVF